MYLFKYTNVPPPPPPPPPKTEPPSAASVPPLPAVSAAPLPETAVVPAKRPVMPVRVASSAATTPAFDEQCSHIQKYLSDTVQRAMTFLTESNPMLQKRKRRDESYARELTPDRMKEVYAQVSVMDFDHEQELMFFGDVKRQSPLNPELWFVAQPCMMHNNCLSMSLPSLEVDEDDADVNRPPFKPMPTMRFYTRAELKTLYTTGQSPSQPSMCLRCLRYTLGSAVLAKEATETPWPPSVLLQYFGNQVDCEQGYARSYCILPSAKDFNGLYLPLVQEFDDLLCVRWDPQTRGYFVDQSLLAAAEHKIEDDYPAQIWRNLLALIDKFADVTLSSEAQPPPRKKARIDPKRPPSAPEPQDFPRGATPTASATTQH